MPEGFKTDYDRIYLVDPFYKVLALQATKGRADRDPRGRTITVAYLAIVDESVAVTGQDDAAKAKWWPLSDLPHLAFDHYDIMQDAIRVYAQTVEENAKTPHDRFKEQKERMHELSKQIREQCAHVKELCDNFTKKE